MDVSTASEGTPLIPKGAISSTGEKREDQTYSSSSSSSSSYVQPQLLAPGKRIYLLVIGILLGAVIYLLRYIYYSRNPIFLPPKTYVYSQPFSTVNPEELDGIMGVNRPLVSRPGNIFARLFANRVLLPTNSWAESLLIGDASYRQESNRVFQIPYIIDTAGYIYGVRAHAAHVQANDRQVQMTFEHRNGLSIGAVENFSPQHHLIHDNSRPHGVARLSVELEWTNPAVKAIMRSSIVRGEPYVKMEYIDATPRVYVQRSLSTGTSVIVDSTKTLICGDGLNNFSEVPVLVRNEIKVVFDTADTTWLIFVSEPMEFVCSNAVYQAPDLKGSLDDTKVDWELESDFFDLRATSPVKHGMIRAAMVNNCTTGQNPINCDLGRGKPRDTTEFTEVIRSHADVYPTENADLNFIFNIASKEEEELRLEFNWMPKSMRQLSDPNHIPADTQLIMFGLPHHQERILPVEGSSNRIIPTGCIYTLHGLGCMIEGGYWSMREHLHRIGFNAPRPPRPEMVADIRAALLSDLTYELPPNYVTGNGDTYFSGKMLAKQARAILIADEVGGMDPKLMDSALTRLRQGTEIWLNGSAGAPMLFDRDWGGFISCGCNFDGETDKCSNTYPECPSLDNPGINFGAGFYNDHHFHYGYHIYAAAVLTKFDPVWARKYHQHVLLFIRDIANPSALDPFFPTWRHKDWYLGSSWANGIIQMAGGPNPNGRNQESSSEAIHAYEAIAMFGDASCKLFDSGNPQDSHLLDSARHIRDMGRLLLATELRSAKTYWHVQKPGPNVTRIYPAIYSPRVVGMLWSMLAQEQTWFGAEPFKSYGIQLMPLTPVAEQRDTVEWVTEMLPLFNASCAENAVCEKDGWSVLVHASNAVIGNWRPAWSAIQRLNDSVFLTAGGNGHSRANTLWYIATRPDNNMVEGKGRGH